MTATESTVAESVQPRKHSNIAYILRSYPRLSQTHILNEILGLERLGHSISIFAMAPSGETLVQEGVARVRARAEFLEGALRRSPMAMSLDHLAVICRHPHRYVAAAVFLARRSDLNAGYTTTTRRDCFAQAVYLAARLQRGKSDEWDIDHVHSHFAHDPALIALVLHRLTGISYSFTAHARDMLQIPASALAERIRHASAVVTICRANVEYLQDVADGNGAKVRLVHTGIDIDAFRPLEAKKTDGRTPVIVAVTRLVEKKGLFDLVRALGLVKRSGRRFRCVIHGDGPLRADISEEIARLSLDDEVELAGPATLAQVRELLPQGDLFALTPFVTEDGDREGLPSSILEAMACGLPVVSTAVAGIPEAVVHGRTGLVAEPHDIEGIAGHLQTLLDDEALRRRMGANSREAIVEHWGADSVAQELSNVFDGARRQRP